MPTADKKDPYRNMNFLVQITGLTVGGFTECSGFMASNDAIEYREGGDNTHVRKLPGLTKVTNITLKYGLGDSTVLWDWFKDVTNGKIDRRNGSIVVLDLDGKPVAQWNFTRGWPTKIDFPDFNATANQVAIESFEIACETIERG